MRILKFRAWDSKNKKFPFKDFHIIGECTAFDLLNQYRLEEFNDLVITQFTGLTDKNGAEIYEGDIIADCVRDDENPEQVTPLIISFKHGSFCFLDSHKNLAYNNLELADVKDDIIDGFIIGNIFENPELLKNE